MKKLSYYFSLLLGFLGRTRNLLRIIILTLLVLFPFVAPYLVSFLFEKIDLPLMVFFSCTAVFSVIFYAPLFFVNTTFAVTAVYFISSLIGYAILFYIEKYGHRLDTTTIFAFFETTILEATEYTGSFSAELISKPLAVYVSSLLLCFIIALVLSLKVNRVRFAQFVCFVSVIMLLGLFSPNFRTVAKENVFVKSVRSYQMYNDELERFKNQNLFSVAEPVTVDPAYEGKEVHVIIIGESTTRSALGIYGYERDTTPKLSALKDGLFVFTDVISPHAHTIAVMKKLLTFESFTDVNVFDQKGSLIQFLRAAGYKTYWISNHKEYGIEETLTSAMGKASDVIHFLNDGETNGYDQAVVTKMFDIIKTDSRPKKVFFLHFLGSHMKYDKRYPPEFVRFTGKAYANNPDLDTIINTYDNTIVYTDYLINEVIDKVNQLGFYSTVMYFSDHGEDVFRTRPDFLGHSENLHTKYMFEIPFILWASEKYKAANPEKINIIKQSVNRPYQTDNFIFTYTDLLNVKYPSFIKEKSLINKNYKKPKRIVGGEDFDNPPQK